MDSKPTILVVDDDSFLATAYKERLGYEGFKVIISLDGKQALEELNKKVPDLMLLDLIMPVMDGFSVLEGIKDDPKFKNLPIIITSNLEQQEDVKRGLSLGAKDYLIKSDISLSELVKKIKSLLGASKAS